MKKPKLYTKNEKGRYEEYQIPDLDVSDTLFRRINGKYVPVSVNCTNDLPQEPHYFSGGSSQDNMPYNLADMFEKVIRESDANPQTVIENLKSAFEYE